MLLCLFGIFMLPTLTWIFSKTLRRISKVLLKFYHVTIFKDLTTLVSKMMTLKIVKSEDVIVFWVQP